MGNTGGKILKIVRSFFKNLKWKKILAFSFFVLLATIFWFVQIWRQKFDETLVIPVKYINIPDSIVFESELPNKVYAGIRDDGAALIRYYLTRRNDSLVVDIREIIKSSPEKVIQGRNFEQLIRSKLFITSELISYSPTEVSYAYSVLKQKKLPVIYDGYINLAPGYLIDGDLILNPDSILLYGSQASLDTIKYAHTITDTLTGITSFRKMMVSMKPVKGIKFVPDSVELTVLVDEFIEKELEVPVTCVNAPSDLTIRFFPSSVKIPILVGKKRYSSINAEDFEVLVDYDDIKDFSESSIPVRITQSPDYIQTKIPIPSEVEFVLEKK